MEVEGERRPAWADPGLVGPVREGDDVLVNTEALDLGLGSGGFDLVCANLTRGLAAPGAADAHVMKLNYSPIQHPVTPVERGERDDRARMAVPVLVISLHGHLAPAAWAAAQARPGVRVGYVQTAGGALPGRLSRDVTELRRRELLCGHVTAGPCYGGEAEAITVPGALDAAAASLGWQAAIAGPGPGILGSATALAHGGLAALETAHAALALELPVLLAPRLSEGDPRPRHRGVSHHTRTVLELLLGGVAVPLPEEDGGTEAELQSLLGDRHELRREPADLEGYAASGLPTRVMGRGLAEDRLFFAAALASGRALASVADG